MRRFVVGVLSVAFVVIALARATTLIHSQAPRLVEIYLRANGEYRSITVTPGSNVTVEYSTNYATSCVRSGNWQGGGLSGSVVVNNVTTYRNYELTCTGAAGSVSARVEIFVSNNPPPPNSPWVDLRINGGDNTTIAWGGGVELRWTSGNVSSCTGFGLGSTRQVGTNGQEGVVGITSTRNYDIVCTGPGGSVTDRVTVFVGPAPTPTPTPIPTPTTTASATPTPPPPTGSTDIRANNSDGPLDVASGSLVTLAWVNSSATSCIASGSWGGTPPVNGTQVVTITANSTYTLTCTGPEGISTDSVSINISVPPPSPSCTISFNPNTVVMAQGTSRDLFVAVTQQANGTIEEVDFQSADTDIVSVSTPDTMQPFLSFALAGEAGQAMVQADAYMGGIVRCSAQMLVNVLTPEPWWQAQGGNVYIGRDLNSTIPVSCSTDPTCLDSFILDDATSGKPGVAIYGGSGASFSAGDVSSTGWLVNTRVINDFYTYDHFFKMASGKIPSGNIVNNRILTSGVFNSATETNGYAYILVPGNAVINNPINVNKKVVFFVEGNLRINNRILVNDLNNNFLMVIVKGNISISPSVTSRDLDTPALQGIFFTDGVFSTGTNGVDDGVLVTEGIVAASDVDLERNLNTENQNTPAELFIFSPELVINYPIGLSDRHLVWRELAP